MNLNSYSLRSIGLIPAILNAVNVTRAPYKTGRMVDWMIMKITYFQRMTAPLASRISNAARRYLTGYQGRQRSCFNVTYTLVNILRPRFQILNTMTLHPLQAQSMIQVPNSDILTLNMDMPQHAAT